MAGSASVPNVFGALAGNISLALLDQNYAALVGYANDPTNRVSVAVDSGAANGYVLTPSPAIPNYSNPLIVWFVPAHSNTTTSTANISGKGALTIFKDSGAGPVALTGGEIIAANWCGIAFDSALASGAGGFHLLNPVQPVALLSIANSLVADAVLNNIANYFDGPSVAQGTVGTWFASGTVTLVDTASSAQFQVKLWDGTTVIDSASVISSAAAVVVPVSVSGFLASPAGNLRISVKDISSTSGLIKFNASGNSKDSTITAVRIA